jgi:hypothetical protein
MKAILNGTWHLVDVELAYDLEEADVMKFDEGDEVEILKVIEDADEFLSGVAYVVFNPKNKESVTIDSSLVTLID